MSGPEDRAHEARRDAIEEKYRRTFLVTVKVVAIVSVEADKDTDDVDLLEMAMDKITTADILDRDAELIDVEVDQ